MNVNLAWEFWKDVPVKLLNKLKQAPFYVAFVSLIGIWGTASLIFFFVMRGLESLINWLHRIESHTHFLIWVFNIQTSVINNPCAICNLIGIPTISLETYNPLFDIYLWRNRWCPETTGKVRATSPNPPVSAPADHCVSWPCWSISVAWLWMD